MLTASIGTAVFATLKSDVGFAARLIIGTVSVAAAILSAVQVFAALPSRSNSMRRLRDDLEPSGVKSSRSKHQ